MTADPPLSPCERDALADAARGLTCRESAAARGVTMHTIKRHIENARWKLGAASKTRAVVLAIMRGDIVLDDVREGVVYVSRDRVGA